MHTVAGMTASEPGTIALRGYHPSGSVGKKHSLTAGWAFGGGDNGNSIIISQLRTAAVAPSRPDPALIEGA
jgi:hypothetical protein